MPAAYKQLNIRIAEWRFKGLKNLLKQAADREKLTQGEVIEKALKTLASQGNGTPDWIREDPTCRDSNCQYQAACESQKEELAETLKQLVACQQERIAMAGTRQQGSEFTGNPGHGQPVQPRRESGSERAAREKAEREARARSRSSVGDDPSLSFDGEYVQE